MDYQSPPWGNLGMCIQKAHIVRCRLLVVPLRLRFAIRTGSSTLRYSNRFVYTSLFGQVRLRFAIRTGSSTLRYSNRFVCASLFEQVRLCFAIRTGSSTLRYSDRSVCASLFECPGIELVVSEELLHGLSVAPEVISVCAQKKPTSCDAGF